MADLESIEELAKKIIQALGAEETFENVQAVVALIVEWADENCA